MVEQERINQQRDKKHEKARNRPQNRRARFRAWVKIRLRWMRLRRWPIARWTTLVILVIAALITASRYVSGDTDPIQFVTGNLLNVLIFAAIVAQVLIYRKQRDIMRHQWRSMQGQLDAMERQWQSSLAAVRPIVEIVIYFEPPTKGIVFVLRNIGKSSASVQFSYKITLGNRVVLSGETPEFEIDISGQEGHGQWRREFPTDMTDDEVAVANGPLDQRVSLTAELAGRYWWEADSYPINMRRKRSGVTGHKFDVAY